MKVQLTYTIILVSVYNTIYLYALQSDHHSKSIYHPSPYKANTVLLTPFPMLFITSPWLVNFIPGSLYFFILFTHFAPTINSSPFWQPPIFFFFNSIHSLHQMTRNRTRGKGSRINSHHLFTTDLCEGKVLIVIVPFIVVDHWFIVFGIIRSSFPAGPNDSRPTLLSCRHRVLWESKAIITTQTNPSTVPAGARHTEWPIKSHPYNWLMLGERKQEMSLSTHFCPHHQIQSLVLYWL